jgi:hypothetical protein
MLDSLTEISDGFHGFATEMSLSTEDVADTVVAAMEEECFLILPHPEVEGYFRAKAGDYDRWLAGMRRLQRDLGA